MSKPIKAIFFDYGGTLFDYEPSNTEVWANIANGLGLKLSLHDPRIQQGMRKQSQEFEKLGKPSTDLSGAELHRLNCYVLAAMGIDGEGIENTINAEFIAREQGKMYTLRPCAPETLQRITQKDIQIGLLSNVDSCMVPSRRLSLKEQGLLNFFNAVILSAEVGVEKPQKAIFDIALQEIGLENPAEVMHVGDCPIVDVSGARNAGLIPVLFDPLDLFLTANVIKIRRLSDILQYLD